MQKFLQFKHQSFYKLALSFLMEVARQNQSTQNRKLLIFLQYIKKSAATAFVFYRGAFMFVVICSEWFNLKFSSYKVFRKLLHSEQPVFVKSLFTATLSACFKNMFFLKKQQIAGDSGFMWIIIQKRFDLLFSGCWFCLWGFWIRAHHYWR